MIDEDEAPEPPPHFVPLGLQPLGAVELAAYRAELVAELARVDAELARKQAYRTAADAFFHKP